MIPIPQSQLDKFITALKKPHRNIMSATLEAGISRPRLYRYFRLNPDFKQRVDGLKQKRVNKERLLMKSGIQKALDGDFLYWKSLMDRSFGKAPKAPPIDDEIDEEKEKEEEGINVHIKFMNMSDRRFSYENEGLRFGIYLENDRYVWKLLNDDHIIAVSPTSYSSENNTRESINFFFMTTAMGSCPIEI